MIDYIIGKVSEITPTVCILECNGIGYEVFITIIDYAEIQKVSSTKLYIHEIIREDAHTLFGFLTKETRELFRLLIGVSGVGPNTARLVLSSLTASQLEESISTGNDHMLKSVKGIGGKTAQRIIVDLKDKIKGSANSFINTSMMTSEEIFRDALAALVTLGFSQLPSQKALRKIFMAQPQITAEEAIKLALKML